VVAAAKDLWVRAGLDAATISQLNTISIRLADLDGLVLAEEHDGEIVLDRDAAGFGWYLDPTPNDSREFQAAGSAKRIARPGRAADRRMGLLTAIAHGLGHIPGVVTTTAIPRCRPAWKAARGRSAFIARRPVLPPPPPLPIAPHTGAGWWTGTDGLRFEHPAFADFEAQSLGRETQRIEPFGQIDWGLPEAFTLKESR
jgi:hypothetical protein